MSRPRDWSPLRAVDPLAGDPEAVTRLAQRYAATAEQIDSAVRALAAIGPGASSWESQGGRAFRERAVQTSKDVGRVHERYARAADALSTYARELRAAQERGDAALHRAQVAAAEIDLVQKQQDARAQTTEFLTEPTVGAQLQAAKQAGQDEIHRAAVDLQTAETGWQDAGRKAATAIQDVVEHDGLNDRWYNQAMDVVATVTRWAGRVSAVLGVLALVLCVIGLAPLGAAVGAIAFAFGVLSLAGNTIMWPTDRAGWKDVAWDAAATFTFGAGRAFAAASDGVAQGVRAVAKTGQAAGRTTSWPTRAEWVDGFDPRRIFSARGAAAQPRGRRPRRPTKDTHGAGVGPAIAAHGIARVADGLGGGIAVHGIDTWARPSRPRPVGPAAPKPVRHDGNEHRRTGPRVQDPAARATLLAPGLGRPGLEPGGLHIPDFTTPPAPAPGERPAAPWVGPRVRTADVPHGPGHDGPRVPTGGVPRTAAGPDAVPVGAHR